MFVPCVSIETSIIQTNVPSPPPCKTKDKHFTVTDAAGMKQSSFRSKWGPYIFRMGCRARGTRRLSHPSVICNYVHKIHQPNYKTVLGVQHVNEKHSLCRSRLNRCDLWGRTVGVVVQEGATTVCCLSTRHPESIRQSSAYRCRCRRPCLCSRACHS